MRMAVSCILSDVSLTHMATVIGNLIALNLRFN